jgi:hypothetical protein
VEPSFFENARDQFLNLQFNRSFELGLEIYVVLSDWGISEFDGPLFQEPSATCSQSWTLLLICVVIGGYQREELYPALHPERRELWHVLG